MVSQLLISTIEEIKAGGWVRAPRNDVDNIFKNLFRGRCIQIVTFEQIHVVSDRGNCIEIRGKSSPYRERTAREMTRRQKQAWWISGATRRSLCLQKSEIRGKKR